MIFANIEYLFLLVLLIPYIIWYVMRRQKTEPTLQVSTTRMYMKVSRSWKIYLLHAPFVPPNGGHRHGNSHFWRVRRPPTTGRIPK